MKVSIKELLKTKVIAITHEVGKAEYYISDDFLVMAGDPCDEFIITDIVWDEEFDYYVGFDLDDNHLILSNNGSDVLKVQVYHKVIDEFFCG